MANYLIMSYAKNNQDPTPGSPMLGLSDPEPLKGMDGELPVNVQPPVDYSMPNAREILASTMQRALIPAFKEIFSKVKRHF
ncbi:hypothetical protein PoB_006823900 [Plakobranchus ocellatus]|uniref:Uncharacterized protein n=1 Tax=Plakobranchus ocellatus TaxID=259542 RepID=A0AAV4DC04_9GAST|nr:hypothetical protein PoB_006823900 [Plakobranchus ocellatus]